MYLLRNLKRYQSQFKLEYNKQIMKKENRLIKNGDRLLIHYRAILEDGSEFETTFDKDPLEITLGETKILKGFNNALLGMSENETKTITLAPDDAYGHHDPALIAVLDKNELPPNSIPAVGWMLRIGKFKVMVKEIGETTVTLDGNHPLVGKSVSFEITVVKVK
jgi:peptidylprolyl isomerase